jgi:hypothetical protein
MPRRSPASGRTRAIATWAATRRAAALRGTHRAGLRAAARPGLSSAGRRRDRHYDGETCLPIDQHGCS